MKTILEMINTVSNEDLIGKIGVSKETAENIISTRPYKSEQEFLESGMLSQEEIDRLTEDFSSSDEIKEKSTDTEEKDTSESVSYPASSNSRVRKWIFRGVLAFLFLAILGSIAYFGIPLFIEKILNPLETNTSRVSEIAADYKADVDRLEAEITILQERSATLESRADGFDELLAAHNATLQKLEEMQVTLQAGLDEHKAEVISQINEQLTLNRAIELLSRSRLYLSQNNYGMARADAASAHALLTSLLPSISADQDAALRTVIKRLELALENLPKYPVVAVYDIDYAWQLLVDGLPNVPAMVVTPVVTESAIEPTVTATPEPTIEPGS